MNVGFYFTVNYNRIQRVILHSSTFFIFNRLYLYQAVLFYCDNRPSVSLLQKINIRQFKSIPRTYETTNREQVRGALVGLEMNELKTEVTSKKD